MNYIKLIKQKFLGTIQFFKEYGLKKTIIVIKRILLHQPIENSFLEKRTSSNSSKKRDNVEDILNHRFRNMQPLQYIYNNNSINRVNLIMNGLSFSDIKDGITYIIILIALYAKKNNLILRIITRNENVNPNTIRYIFEKNGLQFYNNIELYSDSERDVDGNVQYKLDVSDKEQFFTTSLENAVALRRTFINKQFVHIYLKNELATHLCDEDYFMFNKLFKDDNIRFIDLTNSLDVYVKNTNNIINSKFPILRDEEDYSFEKKEKIKLYFYATPAKQNSMFYRGIELIDYSIKMHILDTNICEIYCEKNLSNKLTFCNGYEPHIVECSNLIQYDKFLENIDLILSFEKNSFMFYTLFKALSLKKVYLGSAYLLQEFYSEYNNLLFTDFDTESYMESLKKALDLALNIELRNKNSLNIKSFENWENELQDIYNYF